MRKEIEIVKPMKAETIQNHCININHYRGNWSGQQLH